MFLSLTIEHGLVDYESTYTYGLVDSESTYTYGITLILSLPIRMD